MQPSKLKSLGDLSRWPSCIKNCSSWKMSRSNSSGKRGSLTGTQKTTARVMTMMTTQVKTKKTKKKAWKTMKMMNMRTMKTVSEKTTPLKMIATMNQKALLSMKPIRQYDYVVL